MSSRAAAISKPELVTLALGELGGSRAAVDTEDVAVRSHELSPVAFAWRRYPQHINLELVRVALVGATRMGLAKGRGRGGWVLTDAGVEWFADNRDRLIPALQRVDVAGLVKQTEPAHRERERLRIGRTEALRKWRAGDPVSGPEASAVFRRGAFYTPQLVGLFLARWAVRSGRDRVLEPSAGNGGLVSPVVAQLGELGTQPGIHVVAVEQEHADAEACRQLGPSVRVIERDFFTVLPEDVGRVDAVIGNPPYIRYQLWHGPSRERGFQRARDHGIKLSPLASSWAAFVVHASQFLGEDGRLGLVLPLELLTSDYAEPIRQYLPRRFTSVTLLAIDEPVFPDATVSTVLLLAGPDGPPGVRIQRLPSARALGAWLETTHGARDVSPETGEPGTRWSASLDEDARRIYGDLLASDKFLPFGILGSVDIGVVTGADAFFVLDAPAAANLRLSPDQHVAIVRRPGALKGMRADPSETSRLLVLPRVPLAELANPVRDYVETGVTLGLPLRHKCSRREPWYSLRPPSRRPDAFFRYMNHDAARVVTNEIGALSTNLLHGVRLRPGAPDVHAVAAAMLSSPSRLSAEIEGRSYGGGVLKLETKEAEKVLIPRVDGVQEAALLGLFPTLDRLVGGGDLDGASALVDEALGFDTDQVRSAARRLGRRRMGRKGSASMPEQTAPSAVPT